MALTDPKLQQAKCSSLVELPVFMRMPESDSDESESDSDAPVVTKVNSLRPTQGSSGVGSALRSKLLAEVPGMRKLPSADNEKLVSSTNDSLTVEGGAPARKMSELIPDKNSGEREKAMVKLSMAVTSVRQKLEAKANHVRNQRKTLRKLSTTDFHIETSRLPCTPVNKPDMKKIIYFDWDDTLFPTWFLEEVLEPYGLTEVFPSSPFYAGMCKHARAIESVVRAARQVADVAIVTLAKRPWVTSSAARFLPSLNINEFLQELNIPVYYANEHVPASARYPQVKEEEMDIHVIAKCKAMSRFMNKVCKKGGVVSHIMSIGDSHAEAEALKELVWSRLDNSNATTIRLLKTPSLEELTDELELLAEACLPLVCREGDADFRMDSSDDVETMASLL